jgi:hypothetical protein
MVEMAIVMGEYTLTGTIHSDPWEKGQILSAIEQQEDNNRRALSKVGLTCGALLFGVDPCHGPAMGRMLQLRMRLKLKKMRVWKKRVTRPGPGTSRRVRERDM